MFTAIADFPEVSPERDDQFQAWFAWSNDELRGVDGLTGRRLLRSPDGRYTAVVDHASAETFAAMHATAVASKVHARLREILNEEPDATKYEVVSDLATSKACCGGRGDHGHGHHGTAAGSDPDVKIGGGCCRGA